MHGDHESSPEIHLVDQNLSLVSRELRANALPGSCGMMDADSS